MQTNSNIRAILERVLTWPPERQQEAARMPRALEAQEGELYHPTDEEWTAIEEGFAQAQRGEFASDEDIEAVWSRHGL